MIGASAAGQPPLRRSAVCPAGRPADRPIKQSEGNRSRRRRPLCSAERPLKLTYCLAPKAARQRKCVNAVQCSAAQRNVVCMHLPPNLSLSFCRLQRRLPAPKEKKQKKKKRLPKSEKCLLNKQKVVFHLGNKCHFATSKRLLFSLFRRQLCTTLTARRQRFSLAVAPPTRCGRKSVSNSRRRRLCRCCG